MYYNQIKEHIAVNHVKVSNLLRKTHVQVEGEEKVYELENWHTEKIKVYVVNVSTRT